VQHLQRLRSLNDDEDEEDGAEDGGGDLLLAHFLRLPFVDLRILGH
jgi:hypothetical protein